MSEPSEANGEAADNVDPAEQSAQEPQPYLKPNGKRVKPQIKGNHPTKAECLSRLEFAYNHLCRRAYKWDIVRAMKRLFKASDGQPISTCTCLRYLRRAREKREREIAAEKGLAPQVLHEKNKDAALSFWQSMARDARVGPKMQMEAQREVELHQGVRPAQEHRVTGQLGTSQRPTVIVREVIVRTRAEAQAVLAMQREQLAQIQAQRSNQ
jgi:hypothetical protein